MSSTSGHLGARVAALSAVLGAGSAGAAGSAAAKAPPPVRCLTLEGPCTIADTSSVVLAAGKEPLLATNFGLLFPAASAPGVELACEETFGGQMSSNIRAHADGRVFVPGPDGLYVSPDGCGFVTATGSLKGRTVEDVAFDARRPTRVWALTYRPATLHLSDDGGKSFVEKAVLGDFQPRRVFVPAANPDVMYVGGFRARSALVLAVSRDGGERFEVDETGGNIAQPPRSAFVLGVDPGNADVLLAAVSNPEGGDEIHRSETGGKTWTKVLTLRGTEILEETAVAFGPAGRVYLGGRELFVNEQKLIDAHLYVSHDSGKTWRDPVLSGPGGPRFRCLGAQEDGRLYACGGDENDTFMLGVSMDEGASWQPVVRLGDIVGAKACSATACASTTVWLCDAYGVCGPGGRPDAGVAPVLDASADACDRDGGCGATNEAEGCGCRVGGRAEGEGAAVLLAGAAALALLRRARA